MNANVNGNLTGPWIEWTFARARIGWRWSIFHYGTPGVPSGTRVKMGWSLTRRAAVRAMQRSR